MTTWNFENCKTAALKCNTFTEFYKNFGGAYNAAKRNGWFDAITSHIILTKKPKYYWNFERCKNEALKYQTKNEFRIKSNSAYQIAKRKKYLNDICKHMILQGNLHKRIIYSYEFSDNYVYIGLTYNPLKRNHEHLTDKKSPVFKHIITTNLIPTKKILTNNYIEIDNVKILEEYWINNYRMNGWNLLNKMCGGALGGNKIYWTYDKCYEEALRYKTKYEFQKKSSSAYNSALKNNWLNSITGHMIKTQKPTGYWDINKCHEEALKYTTKGEFQKKSISAYSAACKKKWLNLICSHMT